MWNVVGLLRGGGGGASNIGGGLGGRGLGELIREGLIGDGVLKSCWFPRTTCSSIGRLELEV